MRKDRQQPRKDDEQQDREVAFFIAVTLTIIAVVLMFVSCRSVEYVDRPVTHTEYIYRDRVDTAYVKDSVYIREVVKGDTLRIVEYRYRDRVRYVERTDTICKTDTISVPYPVEKIEYRTRGVVKVFAWLGLGALVLLVLYITLLEKMKR